MAKLICINLFVLSLVYLWKSALSNETVWPPRLEDDAQQAEVGENKAAAGWSEIEVNPNAFMQVIYQGFRVNVYATKPKDVNSTMSEIHYYYPPGLFINASSAYSYLNTLTNRNEMSFKVLMWDEEFEAVIRNAVSKKTGQDIPMENVRVLPIEQIRIDAPGVILSKYEMVNQWMSYASQPSIFEFRFSCINRETCNELANQLRESPQFFVYDLQVSYSLIAQRSARRTIQVKAEHVQAGLLYSQLKQQIPNSDIVYLQADDLKQMTLEIATNVVATEVVDDEFIGQDQSLSITKLLETLLQVKPESSASFQAQMWDSVFWNDENTRPDRVTSELNEVYDKADDDLKDRIREVLQTSQNSTTDVDVQLDAWIFSTEVNTAIANSQAFASDYEREQFKSTLREASRKSQWNGERIVVKPMQLTRTNIARLQSSATITSVQVRVTKSTAELTSRINLLPPPVPPTEATTVTTTVLPTTTMPTTRTTTVSPDVIAAGTIPTGTIQMFFGLTLPYGWLLCDGSLIDCTRYEKLCQLVRNSVSGVARTPDMRGRVPVAAGSVTLPSGGNSNTNYNYIVGRSGGEVNQLLTEGQMPAHSHTYLSMKTPQYWDPSPIHSRTGDAFFLYYPRSMAESGSAWEYISTWSTGANSVHNNMQPYFVVQFIIKT